MCVGRGVSDIVAAMSIAWNAYKEHALSPGNQGLSRHIRSSASVLTGTPKLEPESATMVMLSHTPH